MNLLAAQCAVAQQCIGQDPDTISCKFAADEAFGGGFAPQQSSNGPQRIGDGARDMLAHHEQVRQIAAVGDWPTKHFLRCNPTQTQHRNGFEAKVPGRMGSGLK